jgi:hypothetical protein
LRFDRERGRLSALGDLFLVALGLARLCSERVLERVVGTVGLEVEIGRVLHDVELLVVLVGVGVRNFRGSGPRSGRTALPSRLTNCAAG